MPSSPGLLGHPPGLAYIAFTEAWERFSFYGMQALLVLYMTGHLLLPAIVEHVAGLSELRAVLEGLFGTLSPQALASQIFGLYVGFVYLTPVLGGMLGDRLLGRRRAVLLGAVLMAVGDFLLAPDVTFLWGLAALIAGSALLKGNLIAQVGNLYNKDDRRRDSAFALYITAINVGGFVAPLVCGTLGELYGWHYGFVAAGGGMLISIVIYLSGTRHLPSENSRLAGDPRPRLVAGDWRVILALLALLGLTSLFWIPQAQVWNVYPLWQRDFVDRSVYGMTIPVTWFQSLDSLAGFSMAPLVLMLWRSQRRRATEPADMPKLMIGCALYGVAFLLLSIGEIAAAGSRVALLWPVTFHFVCAAGYLYAAPIALSLVSRAAPAAASAMLAGAYYLGVFVGGVGSGWLARFYERVPPSWFWAMHAFVACVGAICFAVLRRPLMRTLRLDQAAVPKMAVAQS